jgi:hypothetical protein
MRYGLPQRADHDERIDIAPSAPKGMAVTSAGDGEISTLDNIMHRFASIMSSPIRRQAPHMFATLQRLRACCLSMIFSENRYPLFRIML